MAFARVSGLGQWFPEQVRSNATWPPGFEEHAAKRAADRTLVEVAAPEQDACRQIVQRYLELESGDPFLGSKERRVANAETNAVQAEAWAAEAALSDAAVAPSQIDAILSWALVPERLMPSNACGVGALIGAHRAWSASLDAACASPVAQLQTAAAMIESGRAQHILLTQSHLASRTFELTHPASPGVGDGASAIVVSRSQQRGIEHCVMTTAGEHADAVVWRRGRGSQDDPPWWAAGGPLQMGSLDPQKTRHLIQNTVAIASKTISELLSQSELRVENVSALAAVQPRGWIPRAIAEASGLDLERAPSTYTSYAHLGGAGAVVNLLSARDAGLLGAGTRAVLYAQGAGFTSGAISLVDVH